MNTVTRPICPALRCPAAKWPRTSHPTRTGTGSRYNWLFQLNQILSEMFNVPDRPLAVPCVRLSNGLPFSLDLNQLSLCFLPWCLGDHLSRTVVGLNMTKTWCCICFSALQFEHLVRHMFLGDSREGIFGSSIHLVSSKIVKVIIVVQKLSLQFQGRPVL